MQNHYNLAYREEEREMFPTLARFGVGAIPWSPLARGLLTRPAAAQTETARAQGDWCVSLLLPLSLSPSFFPLSPSGNEARV